MKRFWLSITAMFALSACSGTNPFDPGAGSGPGVDPAIPPVIAGELQGITYDPVAQTLTVSGMPLDGAPFVAVYNRRPALDVPGYEAYTLQENELARHTTAYVREVDGVRGAITVSGGQFGYYFGGSTYSRSGSFAPPASGSVTYSGTYVGLRNVAGDGGDLIPVDPGNSNEPRPTQAAEVTGRAILNADFIDNRVNGLIYQRVSVDSGLVMEDLNLVPATIESDGTFTGGVALGNNERGTYGGIFGGTNASAVAGTLFVEDQAGNLVDQEEYGLFVLTVCDPNTQVCS